MGTGNPNGRPSDYTDELAKEICHALATSSHGLNYLTKHKKDWPAITTLNRWIAENRNGFRDMYIKAKQDQADYMVEEMLEISDDSSKDTITRIGKDGQEYEVCNSEYVNRSRLRVETRKWIASKLLPKVYGERQDKTVGAEEKSLLQNIIDKL